MLSLVYLLLNLMGDAAKIGANGLKTFIGPISKPFYQFPLSGFDRQLVSLRTIFFLLGSIEFHVYEKFENTKRW